MGWHVVITEPQAEYLAASELINDGYEVFFPRVKTPHNRSGHIDGPLFPGYLFLQIDPSEGTWPTFRPNHRVLGWVKFGGIVPTLPDETIEELAKRVESINTGEGLWRRYRAGERVRVVSKIFDDLAEIVEEAKSPQGKARVLLQFLGRQISAQVPWADLRPVQDRPNEHQRPPRRTRGNSRWIRGFRPAGAAAR